MDRLQAKLIAVATSLAMAFAAAGCDLQEDADLENGRVLFNEQCGECHALAEAGSAADIGPDLDAAFADARANGFDQDTIEGIVEYQITTPRETDPSDPTYMPADLVTGDEKRDVAAYVASVAGIPGIEPPKLEESDDPGAQIFANNGCGACHIINELGAQAQGAVGPNLDQVLPGQRKKMIEQSIVAPDEVIADGYEAGIMPGTYGESIPPEDLELLVDYLATVAAGGGSGGGDN